MIQSTMTLRESNVHKLVVSACLVRWPIQGESAVTRRRKKIKINGDLFIYSKKSPKLEIKKKYTFSKNSGDD